MQPQVQLGQAVAVAAALADAPGPLPASAVVYLPDEAARLAPAGELAQNDAPWLAGQVGVKSCDVQGKSIVRPSTSCRHVNTIAVLCVVSSP
jgi:hypothetical protein